MNVSIINIDSKIPNLALKKIEMYHKLKGDTIIWDNELQAMYSDRVYVSCIFTKNKDKCKQFEGDSIIGGTGYNLKIELPDYIERLKPKINFGFTTRGCIRKCKFCVVPEKEGIIHAVGDIYDIWDGISKEIVLMDNNILALPSHFKKICSQLKGSKLKVDFNQGLDIRLLNNELAYELSQIKHISDIRFAWDNIADEDIIMRGIELLKKHNCKRAMFYVLCGFNSTIEEDLYRFNKLKSLGQRAYCMRYEAVTKNREYSDLASWVNQPRFFISMDFERFKECRSNRKLVCK